jgi:hypothetical protein
LRVNLLSLVEVDDSSGIRVADQTAIAGKPCSDGMDALSKFTPDL